MKSSSNIKPKTFDAVGDGSWFYHYNVVDVDVVDVNGDKSIIYKYEEVRVWSIDDNTLKDAVIRDRYTIGQEANIINNYNRFVLGLVDDESFKTRYIDYLNEITAIKAMVNNDLNERQ